MEEKQCVQILKTVWLKELKQRFACFCLLGATNAQPRNFKRLKTEFLNFCMSSFLTFIY